VKNNVIVIDKFISKGMHQNACNSSWESKKYEFNWMSFKK